MKSFAWFILLFFPTTAFANSEDTLHCSHGVLIDVDKHFVRDIGYKLRLSPSWALCAKVQWTVDSDSRTNEDFFLDQSGSSVKLTIGAEITMFRTGRVSFVGLGLLAYGHDASPSDASRKPTGKRRSTYSIDLGIGAEYALSKQFSVSISQRMGIAHSQTRHLSPDVPRKHTFAYLGDPVAGLMFSF